MRLQAAVLTFAFLLAHASLSQQCYIAIQSGSTLHCCGKAPVMTQRVRCKHLLAVCRRQKVQAAAEEDGMSVLPLCGCMPNPAPHQHKCIALPLCILSPQWHCCRSRILRARACSTTKRILHCTLPVLLASMIVVTMCTLSLVLPHCAWHNQQ